MQFHPIFLNSLNLLLSNISSLLKLLTDVSLTTDYNTQQDVKNKHLEYVSKEIFIQKRKFRETENNKHLFLLLLHLLCRTFIFKQNQITGIKGCIKSSRSSLYRRRISSCFMSLLLVYHCTGCVWIVLYIPATKRCVLLNSFFEQLTFWQRDSMLLWNWKGGLWQSSAVWYFNPFKFIHNPLHYYYF